jgi:hypothetical protein
MRVGGKNWLGSLRYHLDYELVMVKTVQISNFEHTFHRLRLDEYSAPIMQVLCSTRVSCCQTWRKIYAKTSTANQSSCLSIKQRCLEPPQPRTKLPSQSEMRTPRDGSVGVETCV